MPRAFDRGIPARDYDPLANLLNYQVIDHAAEQLGTDWRTSINTSVTDSWNKFFAEINQFINDILDPPGAANPLFPSMQKMIDDIVNWLTGQSATGWGFPDSAVALADTHATLASVQSALAALTQRANQGTISGQSVTVSFSDYPDSTNLPAIFTETYSGSGSGTYGVSGGYAVADLGDHGDRTVDAVYNGFVTDTDYQAVGGVWVGKPVHDGFGNRGFVSLDVRKNAAGTTRVSARLSADGLELSAWNAGTKTQFAGLGNAGVGFFNFKAGAIYFLIAGTAGGVRVFVVTENGAPILTYTDVSTSQVGALYRGTGLGAEWPSSGGNINPGALLYWAAQDNTPAPTVGSYARVYRTNTGLTGLTGFGDWPMPNSTMDTVDRITPDITFDATTNKFTVSKSGAYVFAFHFGMNALIVGAQYAEMLCYKGSGAGSPVIYERKSHGFWDDVSWTRFGASFSVYLAAGEWVIPGQNFPSTPIAMYGEATGTVTYMSLTAANP